MTAYFERLDAHRYRATPAVGGGWNPAEQHVAPSLGLLVHAVERELARRGSAGVRLARLSFDILGPYAIGDVEIAVTTIRPGRTIELVEATLAHGGRTAIVLRAWLMQTSDTSAIAGADHLPLPPLEGLEAWEPSSIWAGEFVRTVDVRREHIAPGRSRFWLRPRLALVADEEASDTARLIGVIDVANGVTPRAHPQELAFPNLDVTVHLIDDPVGEWIGCDTVVGFGRTGTGLTHTVLHDRRGPVGTSDQILTLRAR
ncbi:thioesterase family protein [Microbacterium sp. NPDC055683]